MNANFLGTLFVVLVAFLISMEKYLTSNMRGKGGHGCDMVYVCELGSRWRGNGSGTASLKSPTFCSPMTLFHKCETSSVKESITSQNVAPSLGSVHNCITL